VFLLVKENGPGGQKEAGERKKKRLDNSMQVILPSSERGSHREGLKKKNSA